VSRMADALSPQIALLLELAEKDWELFSEALAHVMVGWSAGAAAHHYATFLRACITPDVMRRVLEHLGSEDVTALLPDVHVPTLVLHRRGVTSVPIARGSELAACIPNARLMIVDGDVMRPGVGDMEAPARAVDEFLGDVADHGPGAAVAAPATHAETSNTFRREGDYWTIAFEGRVSRIRDMKGLHHIARLLREPGRHLSPAELLADLEPPPGDLSRSSGGADLVTSSLGDAGPVLDAKAKAVYRRRLDDLREERADAERCHDAGRAARARTEEEFLARELAAAVGLGGRDRKTGSAAERARLTVTKRIKDALARLATSHPALARHLTTTIKTGHLCAYTVDPTARASWSL
jgi:hypothetical protein